MGIAGRVLSVVVLALTAVALGVNFMLFNQRAELLDRGDKMAEAINVVAKTLDKDSGTDYASKLNNQRMELDSGKNPAAGENIKKSLHHTAYNDFIDASRSAERKGENLERILKPFVEQGKRVIEQRDCMGNAFQRVAETLNLPDWRENFKEADFFDSTKCAPKTKMLASLTDKVTQRKNVLVDYVSKTAAAIDKPMPPEFVASINKFDIEGYTANMDAIVSEIELLKKRSDYYVAQISALCDAVEVQGPSGSELAGADYPAALSSILTKMRERRDQFAKVEGAMADAKSSLSETNKSLADLEKKHESLAAKVESARQLQEKLKKIIFGGPADLPEEPAEIKAIVGQLEGKVLEVNNQFDYVIIDLGAKNKVTRLLPNGKRQTVTPVSIPPDCEMIVSRGDKFIAKVKVFRIEDEVSVATMAPSPRGGKVEVGDRVFFAPKPNEDVAAAPQSAAVPATMASDI